MLGNASFVIQLFSREIELGKNGNLCYREICQNCMLYNTNQVLTGCGFDLCHCSKKKFLLAKASNKNEAIEIINQELERQQKGQKINNYHLRDWIFSRQRYWGEPIPVIHWENVEQGILKDEELPLKLPPLTDFAPSPLYYSPLQKVGNWVNVKREDGILGKRDINVMPQWAGSCWYYIAFLLKKNDTYLALNSSEAKEIINNWLPVDLYIGGQEHANLHLLYARFLA